jgi:hypothetical protein
MSPESPENLKLQIQQPKAEQKEPHQAAQASPNLEQPPIEDAIRRSDIQVLKAYKEAYDEHYTIYHEVYAAYLEEYTTSMHVFCIIHNVETEYKLSYRKVISDLRESYKTYIKVMILKPSKSDLKKIEKLYHAITDCGGMSAEDLMKESDSFLHPSKLQKIQKILSELQSFSEENSHTDFHYNLRRGIPSLGKLENLAPRQMQANIQLRKAINSLNGYVEDLLLTKEEKIAFAKIMGEKARPLVPLKSPGGEPAKEEKHSDPFTAFQETVAEKDAEPFTELDEAVIQIETNVVPFLQAYEACPPTHTQSFKLLYELTGAVDSVKQEIAAEDNRQKYKLLYDILSVDQPEQAARHQRQEILKAEQASASDRFELDEVKEVEDAVGHPLMMRPKRRPPQPAQQDDPLLMPGEQQKLDNAKQLLINFIKAQVLYVSVSGMQTLKAVYFAIQPCRVLMNNQAANHDKTSALVTTIKKVQQFQKLASTFRLPTHLPLNRTLENLLKHYSSYHLKEQMFESKQYRAEYAADSRLGFKEFNSAATEFEASIDVSLDSLSSEQTEKLASVYRKIKRRNEVKIGPSSLNHRAPLETLHKELKDIQENFPALKLDGLLYYYVELNPALRHAFEQKNNQAFEESYLEYKDKKLPIEERYRLLYMARKDTSHLEIEPRKDLTAAIEKELLNLSEAQVKALKDLYHALQSRDKLEATASPKPRLFARLFTPHPQKKLTNVLELIKNCKTVCQGNVDLFAALESLEKHFNVLLTQPAVHQAKPDAADTSEFHKAGYGIM